MVVIRERFEVEKFNFLNFLHEPTSRSRQKLLTEAIATGNEHHFKFNLENLKINPDQKLKCFSNLSTFEKVLLTPKSRRFIELCIQHGSDFYRVSCSCL